MEHVWQLLFLVIGLLGGYFSSLATWNRERRVRAQATRKLLAALYFGLEQYLMRLGDAPNARGSPNALTDRAKLLVDRTFTPEVSDALKPAEAEKIYDAVLSVEGDVSAIVELRAQRYAQDVSLNIASGARKAAGKLREARDLLSDNRRYKNADRLLTNSAAPTTTA